MEKGQANERKWANKMRESQRITLIRFADTFEFDDGTFWYCERAILKRKKIAIELILKHWNIFTNFWSLWIVRKYTYTHAIWSFVTATTTTRTVKKREHEFVAQCVKLFSRFSCSIDLQCADVYFFLSLNVSNLSKLGHKSNRAVASQPSHSETITPTQSIEREELWCIRNKKRGIKVIIIALRDRMDFSFKLIPMMYNENSNNSIANNCLYLCECVCVRASMYVIVSLCVIKIQSNHLQKGVHMKMEDVKIFILYDPS